MLFLREYHVKAGVAGLISLATIAPLTQGPGPLAYNYPVTKQTQNTSLNVDDKLRKWLGEQFTRNGTIYKLNLQRPPGVLGWDVQIASFVKLHVWAIILL